MGFRLKPGKREDVLAGLLFGIIAMTGMITTVYFAPGLFFDGRTIILVIAGLFGGPLPAFIAAVMSSVFRYYLGGAGAAAGILMIVESAFIGSLFYYLKKKNPLFMTLPGLFFIAILVHAVMLLCMLAIPAGEGIAVIQKTAALVLLIYPPATVITAYIFLNQEKKRSVENSLTLSEKKHKDYVEFSPYGIFITDSTGKFIEVNKKALQLTGYKKNELLAMQLTDIFQSGRKEAAETRFSQVFSKGNFYGEFPFTKKDGTNCYMSVDAVNLENHTAIGFVQDITERKKTEERLRYRLAIEMIINSFTSALVNSDLYDVDQEIAAAFKSLGAVTETDRVYLFLYDRDIATFFNSHEWCAEGIDSHIDYYQNVSVETYPWWTEQMKNNTTVIYEDINEMPDDSGKAKEIFMDHDILSIAVIPLFHDGKLTGFLGFDSIKKSKRWKDEDIDLLKLIGNIFCSAIVRKNELEEKSKLNDQLVQIQKLESIGRLAGGVAHDFNNILQVIMGFTEMALDDIPPGSGNTKNYLDEIYKASKRSAELTGQLLAFARRQTIKPETINLNQVIESTIKMLTRLIGENIDLIWNPSEFLWNTMIDITQVNQLLTNLTVNSRDALENRKQGKIIIETRNTVIDDAYLKKNAYFEPGEYVMLAVSDNGKGMDRETISHIFEPFYTTKGKEGTGLGLSTVYGIMKQNNGFINTYSEVGEGTTIKLYFKRYTESNPAVIKTGQKEEIKAPADKIILIVEDEATILSLAKEILTRGGYNVITAENGEKALSLSGSYNGRIDLLVTDVVLPEMNGKKLAEAIVKGRSGIKTLFMSGYTANVIAHQGILDEGINFIQKPFTVKDLLSKVNQILSDNEPAV
ncbi:MAG: LytS/YhcK type 5TM receptor domain-containing protein [Spirochaetia bacterium]|jgi:PAS domain S-box-containing protein|nr:LytS/YhcK type 5TM receptor domain-containing protein [Spirochaetia bacterium]